MRECISYRLINNDGRPTIYNASCFTVVSNDLRDMVFDYYGDFCIITHKRFFDTAIGKDNVNGFWAHLFETDDLEALKLVESVAHDINFDQRIILPEIKLR